MSGDKTLIDDVYVEQFVKREKTAYDTAFNVLSVFATVVLIVAVNLIPILLGFIP